MPAPMPVKLGRRKGLWRRTTLGANRSSRRGLRCHRRCPRTSPLDNLFAEQAVLAMNTTNAGVSGSKSFPAAAKALDDNSVALSKAIASVYGTKAGAAGSRPTRPTTQACAPASAAASAAFTATPPARTSIGAWITARWASCGIVTSSSTSPTQTRSGRIA
jgi:hypothetical protein